MGISKSRITKIENNFPRSDYKMPYIEGLARGFYTREQVIKGKLIDLKNEGRPEISVAEVMWHLIDPAALHIGGNLLLYKKSNLAYDFKGFSKEEILLFRRVMIEKLSDEEILKIEKRHLTKKFKRVLENAEKVWNQDVEIEKRLRNRLKMGSPKVGYI